MCLKTKKPNNLKIDSAVSQSVTTKNVKNKKRRFIHCHIKWCNTKTHKKHNTNTHNNDNNNNNNNNNIIHMKTVNIKLQDIPRQKYSIKSTP